MNSKIRAYCLQLSTLTIIVAYLFSACNADDDMQLSYQHTVQVGLYSKYTHRDTSLIDVKIYGIGREDSLLYDVESIGQLFLNMNLNRCTTEFVFRTQTLEDNLFFTYRKNLESVSGSSGIVMELTIDSIGHTGTFIDSVAIADKEIKYKENIENVQIFVY